MLAEYQVRQSIPALRMIFWGGLLWILDFKINGFDLLNDVLASILVAVGVSRLASADVNERYRGVMRWVQLVALLSIIAVLVEMIAGLPEAVTFLLTLFSLVQLASITGFCMAMRWFSLEGGLTRSAESWRITNLLFLLLFAAPLGLLYLGMLVSHLTGSTWNIRLGAEVLLVLVVLAVPLAHFFVSTSRMKREATGGGTYTGHGFEVIPLPPHDDKRPA